MAGLHVGYQRRWGNRLSSETFKGALGAAQKSHIFISNSAMPES